MFRILCSFQVRGIDDVARQRLAARVACTMRKSFSLVIVRRVYAGTEPMKDFCGESR